MTDKQPNDSILSRRVFDAFAKFEKACRNAEAAGLGVYAHMEGQNVKEIFVHADVEISRSYRRKDG